METQLALVVADLALAGEAARAAPARAHERNRYPLAAAPPPHVPADPFDRPRELVPGHVRQLDVRIVAAPAMPVGATEPGRLDAQDDAVDRAIGLGDHLHRDRPA